DVEPEGLRARGDVAPDRAEARDPECLAVHPFGLAELRALPAPRAERRDRIRDAPIERDDHPEDELRDGGRVLPRDVRDVDSALARGAHVDGAVLRAGADDEMKLLGRVDR